MSQDLSAKIGLPAAWTTTVLRDGVARSLAGATLRFAVGLTRGDDHPLFALERDTGIEVLDEETAQIKITAAADKTALLSELAVPFWTLFVKYADGWEGVANEGTIVACLPAGDPLA